MSSGTEISVGAKFHILLALEILSLSATFWAIDAGVAITAISTSFWDILHSAAAYPAVLFFVMIYCITNLPLVKEISVQYGACTAPQILLYWSRIFLRVEGAESYALSAGIEI